MTHLQSEAGPGYFANTREDVVATLDRPLGRVLDIGCGSGQTAAGLRAIGAEHLTGVELVPEAAAEAQTRFDIVIVGPIEDTLDDLRGSYDTILCLDVLEHLVDPRDVLRRLRAVAAPGSQLRVSVPNARHVSLAYDLIVRGTFGYTEWGHRDWTHLRWFTRADIVGLVTDTGWRVVGVGHPELHRSRLLDRLTRGRSTELLVGQWYISARNS